MASFLDLFSATDSDGVSAAKYRLHYLGSVASHQLSWVCGMLTEFAFVVYMVIAIPANALLGLVLSSGSWLQPLSDIYEQITAPFYAVIPPKAIALVGLAIVVASMVGKKVSSTKGGILNSESLNRIGVAVAMVVLVAVLASNPFEVIHWVLNTTSGLATDFAAKLTGSGNSTTVETGQALVNQSVRTPAIVINYGHEFSADCSQQWSDAMASNQELSANSNCYVEGQNEATPLTVITAIIMWVFPAIPMLVFSAVAAWKFIIHLSTSVAAFLMSAWVGAIKVHHRRGFDKVSECFARGAAHMLIAVIITAVAVALPSLCSGIATRILSTATVADSAFLMMVTLGLGFAASTWALLKVSSKKSALIRVLKADVNETLEATLGLKPKNLGDIDFKFFKSNWLRDEKKDSDGSRGGGPQGDAKLKGSGSVAEDAAMNEAIAADDETAVKALSASAESVAQQRSSAVAVPTDAVSTATQSAAGQAAHSNRIWQSAIQNIARWSTVTRIGDVYGYFTHNSYAPEPVDDGVIDAEVVDVTYDDEVYPARQQQLSASPQADTPPPSDPTGPSPVEQPSPTPPPSPPGDGGVLAGSPARSLEHAAVAVSTAGGNVYADADMGAAAQAVGATFSTHVPPPSAIAVASPLPGFSGDHIRVASDVQHGPAVVVVDGVEVSEPSPAASDSSAAPINDQQRWNRAAWRFEASTLATGEDVTAPSVGPELPMSGIAPGVNRHPASFMAPMRDFLAADELLVQKEEVELVNAAMGRTVVAVAPAGDTRLSLRLSSDPDERVVRVCDSEFGDPL